MTMRNPGTIPRLFVSSPRETILDYPVVQHRLSERTMRNPGTIPRLFVSSPRETILDYPVVQHRLSERTMRNPGTIPVPPYRPPGRRYLTVRYSLVVIVHTTDYRSPITDYHFGPASSLGEDDA